jgi:hypothetical protein
MLYNYGKLRPQHRMMDLGGSNIKHYAEDDIMPQVKHYRSNLSVAVLQYT